MHKKIGLANLISIFSVIILLSIGCVSTSRTAYYGGMMFIPLKSSPERAKVILDGETKGFTPMTLEFWYYKTRKGIPNDETQERILKIEKEGYEPYILSFSIQGKEYEKIPNPILLKRIDEVAKTVDSPSKNQQATQELIEAREKIEELAEEIKEQKQEITLLNGEKDIQEMKKYNESAANNQHEYQTIYTIQTGSFPDSNSAEREFDFIEQTLEENQLDYLRIEKVETFYAVRIGKFEDYTTAEKFLQTIKSQLSTAIILEAYIKDQRIIKLYKKPTSTTK